MWGNCEVFGYSWSVARTVGFAGRGPLEDERDSVVKQARAELTRQQIVAGAAAQFEKTGYGSTSMADIVSGAGTTKGALYFHFASKDELAQFIIAEQHRLSIESVQAISATGKDPLEQMIMLTHEMARQIVDEPIVRAGIRLTLELSTYEGPVEPYAEWISAITDLTARAQAEGEIRKSVSRIVRQVHALGIHRGTAGFERSHPTLGPSGSCRRDVADPASGNRQRRTFR